MAGSRPRFLLGIFNYRGSNLLLLLPEDIIRTTTTWPTYLIMTYFFLRKGVDFALNIP
jgi:hypothetical protein